MKIVIADDEKLIRESIRYLLNEIGIADEAIYDVDNGEALLSICEKIPVDLALVDVRMPQMNGLDAIRKCKSIRPEAQYYILSGFDEFKYAQEAVRLGVCDYLLKPVNKSQLEIILDQTITKQEEKRKQTREHLKYLVNEMLESSNEVTFPTPVKSYYVTIDIFPESTFIENRLYGLLADMTYVEKSYGDGKLIFLFESASDPAGRSATIQSFIQSLLTDKTVFELHTFTESRDFRKEMNRIQKISQLRLITGIHCFHNENKAEADCSEADRLLASTACELLRAYRERNYDYYVSCCRKLQSISEQKDCSPKNVSAVTRNLAAIFHRSAGEMDYPVLLSLADSLLVTNNSKSMITSIAIKYMEVHYAESLSIDSMASLLSITPSYFSYAFHKEVGKTFIQYLTDLRIQGSKKLIVESSLTISEIAQKVGYYNVSYFIRKFVQETGITPAEYRSLKRQSL